MWGTWNKRHVSWYDIGPTLWSWTLTSPLTLTLIFWIFKVKFLNRCISGIKIMDCLFDFKWKGCEFTAWCLHCVTLTLDLTHDLDLGFSRWNFENCSIPGIAWDITLLAFFFIFFICAFWGDIRNISISAWAFYFYLFIFSTQWCMI